jgi:hypothetical protein
MLTTDASRPAALFVAYILPVCALLTPCRTGASTSRMINLFLSGSLVSRLGHDTSTRAGAKWWFPGEAFVWQGARREQPGGL